jgi:hypothetical protein
MQMSCKNSKSFLNNVLKFNTTTLRFLQSYFLPPAVAFAALRLCRLCQGQAKRFRLLLIFAAIHNKTSPPLAGMLPCFL